MGISIQTHDMTSHLTALWEFLDVGVLLIDSHMRIQENNPSAERLLGARAGSLLGKTALEATLSYDVLEFIKRAFATLESIEHEIRWGEPAPQIFRVRALQLRNQNELVNQSCLLLIEDVTEFRRLETVRRDFVANVSHELRTPLASIRAMAETLQAGAINDAEVSDRFVNIIVTEVERLTRLLQDLLILSKAELHEVTLGAVDLARTITSVVERIQPQAVQVGVRIEVSIGELRRVKGDADQIEQVLVNLLDNAIKFSSYGQLVSIISTQSAQEVMISVIDEGIGIMSEDLPRIFERFYRADPGRSRQTGGTGLGLSIVRNIVEAAGGKVWVESTYGVGSKFSFTLPLFD